MATGARQHIGRQRDDVIATEPTSPTSSHALAAAGQAGRAGWGGGASATWLRLLWLLFTFTAVTGLLLAMPILVNGMAAGTELTFVLLALICYVPYLPVRYT